MTVIGDSQPVAEDTIAASLPMSQITAAELVDEDSYVNDSKKSGKKIGAMYFYEVSADVIEIVVASGSDQNDPWVKMSGLGALTALTLTVAGDVGDAAGITVQLNLIEDAINSLVTGLVITPA